MATLELETTVSAAECIARLRAVAGSGSWYCPPWPRLNDPMLVRVRGDRFRLMQAVGGPPRNSFRRMFYGEVQRHGQGSLIRGRFKIHPIVRGFMLLWFAGVIAFGVMLVVFNIRQMLGMPIRHRAPGWTPLIVPIAMTSFGVVLVRWGISSSNRGERIVVQYMGERLGAEMRA